MKATERHKLKEDKFAQSVLAATAWARAHQKKIVLVCAALAAIAAGLVWRHVNARNAEAAAARMLAEVRLKARGVAWLETPEREKSLRDVVSMCDTIAQNYPDARAGRLALFEAARTLNEAGQHKEAVSYFEKTLERADSVPGLAMLARYGLAEALEASGDVRGAIEVYGQIRSRVSQERGVQIAWDLGRCYEALGDTARAREEYRRAVESGRGTTWAELAAFRLQAMTASPAPSAPPTEAPAGSTPPLSPAPENSAAEGRLTGPESNK